MSSKPRRERSSAKENGEDGAVVVDRKMIETIKEATGATEEDVKVMLFECNYDANETTSRLIDNPFSQVQSKKDKKKKKEDDRKKDPAPKIVEVRRASSSGGRGRDRERGERGPRSGDRGERGDRNDRGERGNDRGPRATPVSIPEKLAEEPPSAEGGWDNTESEPPPEQPSSTGWGSLSSRAPGPQSSAPQPAPSPAQPVPIRPCGAGTGRSMADLFKQSAANSSSAANHQPPPPPPSYAKPVEANGEVNGWGQLESGQNTDPNSSRQGLSLGGPTVSAPQKVLGSHQAAISAHGSGSIPQSAAQATAVGSLPNVPASPSRRSLDDQLLAPSTTGLGGVAIDPPPRVAYPQDSSLPTSQPAWAPKVPSIAAPGPTLGSSIMSSLVGANSSSAALGGTDLLSAASPSAAQADLALGSSYDARSPVIMPAAGQNSNNLSGGLSLQFGNFSLGGNTGLNDFGTAFASTGYSTAFEPTAVAPESSQAPTGPAASEPYKASSSFAQAPSSSSQQRAYSAFSAAGIQQAPSSQRPLVGSAAPEASSATSQAYYGNQGYPQAGQGYSQQSQAYNQYQAPAAQVSQAQYQNYSAYQTPSAELDQVPVQQAPVQPPKRSTPYDASYGGYGQGVKDFQPAAATKYGAQTGTQVQSTSAAITSTASSLSGAQQSVVPQVPAGYGAAAQIPASMQYFTPGQYQAPYPVNPMPYSGYGNNNYGYQQGQGYGAPSQQAAYASSTYTPAQNTKYNAYQGGAYGGGYGSHKHADKDPHSYQAGHMSGLHSQHAPLGGAQHYGQGAAPRDHSYGGYSGPNQGYGGYGAGRQHGQQQYGGYRGDYDQTGQQKY